MPRLLVPVRRRRLHEVEHFVLTWRDDVREPAIGDLDAPAHRARAYRRGSGRGARVLLRIGTRRTPLGDLRSYAFAACDGAELEAIRLCAELPPEQREQLASVCSEIEVEAGSTLVQEGDFGYVMFAILEGDADVIREGELVNALGPGDVFGERAILPGGRRQATVAATTRMRLITVMNRDVRRLERAHPNVAEPLRTTIADLLPA